VETGASRDDSRSGTAKPTSPPAIRWFRTVPTASALPGLHSRDAASDILFQQCGMHSDQPAFKATPRGRRAARRPIERRVPTPDACEETVSARAGHDRFGAMVMASALLVGTGLVMLIQLTPALRDMLG